MLYYSVYLPQFVNFLKRVAMNKQIITLLCAAGIVMSAPAFAKTTSLKVRPNAPKRYVVKQGDTLWGISGKYLYRPHQWPSLWNVNRAKIRNPHLIYPGQVLYLTYVNGRPVLRVGKGASGRQSGFVKLRPHIRDMGSGYGIQTLDVDFYRLFMKHPQFVSDSELLHAPRIVAGPEGRDVYTANDRIYADGVLESGEYLIFRVSQDLRDPVTGKSLGKLVEFSGEAVTLSNNNSALAERDNTTALDGLKPKQRAKLEAKLNNDEYYVKTDNEKKPLAVRTAVPLTVEIANSEIQRGDYLIPKPDVMSSFNAMPHAPDGQTEARIVSVMDGISEAGMGQTIILNKGRADGVDEGTVLSVYKGNRLVGTTWNNPDKKAAKVVSLPTEEIGLAMVYRAGENVSSAIVLESKNSVSAQDVLREPGQDLETFDDANFMQDGMIERRK